MPLTHITSAIRAEDIIRAGSISTRMCGIAGGPRAYFFYGRPAYRTEDSAVLKLEGACPFCFIFRESLIARADNIHAFDTGAHANRLYSHILTQDMAVEDFSLGTQMERPNKLIAKVFASMSAYFDGDRTRVISASDGAEAWEFHARAYIELISSAGRNEPDDRVCSIEIAIAEAVPLNGNLLAVVVPHTLWSGNKRAPWLEALETAGASILPSPFHGGRAPESYHCQGEGVVRDYYRTALELPV
ncbi:MAG: hypothetical protein R3C16_06360 [Hyphomonadaceae bacterium]